MLKHALDKMIISEKRKVAVFDFDGTLTTKDTLLDFIKFACGTTRFYLGFLLFSPLMMLMKLHMYPNWKCKQHFFSWFFQGMAYSKFVDLGSRYADHASSILQKDVIKCLERLQVDGAEIYVISASIEEWVLPVCSCLNIVNVLGTKVEVDKNGVLTGRLLSKNCYGQEKVNRLLEVEPDRDSYYLYAFGDSRGDKEMLAFADEGKFVG